MKMKLEELDLKDGSRDQDRVEVFWGIPKKNANRS
jgi:hypothetical protein